MVPLPSYTDEELVLLLKSKDQRAYIYLYDNYAGALFGIIKRILGDGEEANDVLQESFVKIWRNIFQYDTTKGRLFTWMINIARNTAIDYKRSSQSKKDEVTNSLEEQVGNTVDENFVTYIKTDHLGLQKIIERLANDHRIIIELSYFQGYTQDEISKKLNIPLGTVKTRARAALMQLKQILN
ncbi:RNA polymerase sigma factor [Olivibacter domesticus]|uniref:RNA polymerase sigma-70 factor, ECF subfamily n=1 Tax=Olivibacter domesticus TaxID=407022 RepID=A0A1H7UVI0_OLID1|nr:sigma-70 family RNA polymerase sigma factor [Olivibacter domesticus]SEM00982.1 RNA polymerase sigma-70 factor, ECF subfamily [Olivibacter domesticus]